MIFRRLRLGTHGVTAVEYAVAAAAITVAVSASLAMLKAGLVRAYTTVSMSFAS